jgi:hypothetical protein
MFIQGVRVRCEGPGREPIDCHKSKLPPGSVATYNCEKTFYIPATEDIEGGKVTCSTRGRWNGISQFHSYSCVVGKSILWRPWIPRLYLLFLENDGIICSAKF